MKKELEAYAKSCHMLGHKFGEEEYDQSKLDWLVGMLGTEFPICILEEAARLYRKSLDHLENTVLPDLLMEEGLGKVVTNDGLEVEIKTEYSPKIVDEVEFFNWMDTQGGASLYKQIFRFGKGEDLSAVRDALMEAGVSYEEKTEIHHQTLKKFVKDMVEIGAEIPADLCAVGQFTHAKIKRTKDK